MSDLTMEDVDETVRSKIYTQSYTTTPKIEGVRIIPVENHLGEDGDFSEIIRLNEKGELHNVSGFKLVQVNRTYLFSKSVKAWHVHFKQDEIWYLPPIHSLFVGLWDIRKNSPTKNVTMRLTLGGGISSLLYIPSGVAHGSANFLERPVNLFYLVNKLFDMNDPDEQRIPWDTKGSEFWLPVRD